MTELLLKISIQSKAFSHTMEQTYRVAEQDDGRLSSALFTEIVALVRQLTWKQMSSLATPAASKATPTQ